MLPRTVVFIGLALAVPIAFAGCGDRGPSPMPPDGTPIPIRAYEPDAADAGLPNTSTDSPEEGAVSAAPSTQGNPLCNASRATGCYPDDVINACDLPADAGPSGAGRDAEVGGAPACHVVSDATGIHTACLPSTVSGMVASSCSRSTECSPGYECVAGGTCRQYCCGGNSACSNNQFCDVQPTEEAAATLVPVCMPEVPCTLLADATCPASEQCSVVRDTGVTSCVTVGTQQDGDPCDVDHCARGLVCLGTLGARHCEPLCLTAHPDVCASTGRTCIGTLPLFQSATFGVCQ